MELVTCMIDAQYDNVKWAGFVSCSYLSCSDSSGHLSVCVCIYIYPYTLTCRCICVAACTCVKIHRKLILFTIHLSVLPVANL